MSNRNFQVLNCEQKYVRFAHYQGNYSTNYAQKINIYNTKLKMSAYLTFTVKNYMDFMNINNQIKRSKKKVLSFSIN